MTKGHFIVFRVQDTVQPAAQTLTWVSAPTFGISTLVPTWWKRDASDQAVSVDCFFSPVSVRAVWLLRIQVFRYGIDISRCVRLCQPMSPTESSARHHLKGIYVVMVGQIRGRPQHWSFPDGACACFVLRCRIYYRVFCTVAGVRRLFTMSPGLMGQPWGMVYKFISFSNFH